jgi:DNA helicase-2/ATP-dependent DNA helicase PcrA
VTAGPQSDLNPEQSLAVQKVVGPVCILAGAGSGKTTTITHRIAKQVQDEAFRASEILAVTFTDKAATEMRSRLSRLGVGGVRASTFHSAAFAQLRALSAEPPAQVLPSKAQALRQIANTLPKPYRFRPAADLATEVEWCRNRRIRPDNYLSSLSGHEPPIPADLMAGVFRRYEEGKKKRGLIDFEDLLELSIKMYERDEDAAERFRARYRAFTVDEYQDVNLLQQTLLLLWLGGRDDLCVVGDDYQSIYGFTGASPRYLIEMPRMFPRTFVARLEHNYRSTPQVLEIANRLVPKLGGAQKVLKAVRDGGPEPTALRLRSEEAEREFVVGEIRKLAEQGVPYEQIAILHRTNFRSDDFEEAFAAAGIPFQLPNAAFLGRQTFRRFRSQLSRRHDSDVAAAALALAQGVGYLAEPPDGLGEQELTRQSDLARLVRLAEEFEGAGTCSDFVADVEARFGRDGAGRGVNLLTYHRAKGLEFEAVFLPRLNEGELPFKRAQTTEQISEERRLFYVGVTRAKTHLCITWVRDRKWAPSPFLDEIGVLKKGSAAAPPGDDREDPDEQVVEALKEWRLKRSRADAVPAYVVLHDSTLADLAGRKPKTLVQLASITGIGPAKVERYGRELLEVLGVDRPPA